VIKQGLCDSFMVEVFKGEHAFGTHTFKIALYTEDADLGVDTTAYSATNELVHAEYPAGGYPVTMPVPTMLSGVSSSTPSFSWPVGANSISGNVRGALIYNDSHASKAAVMVLDFGDTVALTSEKLSITFLPIGLNGFFMATNTSQR
jgi:hypothetical protein